MNKTTKVLLVSAAVLTGLVFTGNTGININTPAAVMASQKQQHFSKQNYALMAYLKWSNKDLESVDDQSITLNQDQGNTFTTTADDGQSVTIKVGSSKVTVKGADGNQKTYKKAQLRKAFKGQVATLNNKVASAQSTSTNTETTTNNASQTQQASTQQQQPATSSDDDSDSDSVDDGDDEMDPNTEAIMREWHRQETLANLPYAAK